MEPSTTAEDEMTPQKAIEILTEATSHLAANRETHLVIIQALKTLDPAHGASKG